VTRRPRIRERVRRAWDGLEPIERVGNIAVVVLAFALIGLSLWSIADDDAPGWADELSGWISWAALAAVILLVTTTRRGR
jgi:hypothetical protein